MKCSINSTFAAAMLITLAIAGPAAAAPPSDTADIDNTALYEAQQDGQAVEEQANASPSGQAQQEQAAEDQSQTLAVSASADSISADVSEAKTAEEDNTFAAQTAKPSEKRTLKNDMKHALLGLLLPAVERRVRKAVDSDGHAPGPASSY